MGTHPSDRHCHCGVSLLLITEPEHPRTGQKAFIPVSPLFSLPSPGSSPAQHCPTPHKCSQPSPVPQDTKETPASPHFSQPMHQPRPGSSSALMKSLLPSPRCLDQPLPSPTLQANCSLLLCVFCWRLRLPLGSWHSPRFPLWPPGTPWHTPRHTPLPGRPCQPTRLGISRRCFPPPGIRSGSEQPLTSSGCPETHHSAAQISLPSPFPWLCHYVKSYTRLTHHAKEQPS